MNTLDQFQINIQNSQNHIVIDASQLEAAACYLLQSEKVNQADISLAVFDNPTVRELNQQYLAHDYDTDVLSFLLDCQIDPAQQIPEIRGAGKTIEGEVIVSAEMAVAMAEKYQWSAENELLLYVVHGLLHLCGYDDLSESELQLMRTREQQIFDHWGLKIPRREE
ncbi:rRNA maturation RNase YbeY [Gimesia fumaroli]|jgi:probable rRNA maturation factor|uniref:Endoribonuclease YbeY n=1 Tax=Gimesia fumaroli TaxID=2527976 RepID=A0A518IBM1_9PLAN|nr:rRNA maturation RNase YbeY [Gimesia fumaroli]QDV50429.1 Endoribonuclease YbeY [Gimesia fumaroli]